MKRLALLGLLAVLPIFAQQPAQQAAQPPKSIIADVHPSSTPHMFAADFGGVLSEGRYAIRDATMLKLIKEAYDVNQDDIAGGPGWMSYDIFDVIFKVPAGTTPSTVRPILQSVLADRFGLVVHHDTRPMPRWVLTVGKGGPKLKASDGTGKPGCKTLQGPGMGGPFNPASVPDIKVTCHSLTSAAIAENLNQMARGYLAPDSIDSNHKVIDSTKLKGSWDFDLQWTSRWSLTAKGTSIFDAVNKQLGLKLEEQNIPMPVLVVDKVNRRPTDNPPAVATMLAIPPARFEVASVKPADPSKRPFMGILYTGGSQVHAGGTLRFLIGLAYQIPFRTENDLVVGLPKSADSQRWDILAKLPSTGEGAPNTANGRPMPPALSVATEMLRGVLLDQFELKAHRENRDVTVWALTRRNGAPKMARADDSERTGCKADLSAPKPAGNIAYMVRCKNESMAQLAENLQRMAASNLDHPIVDATSLKGGWDFLLGWTPTSQMQKPAQPSAGQPGATPTASDPSVPGDVPIFDAVERQLNLKLVKEKRSVPVIVVDHVDEQPIE